jgi:hypothetical protein
MKSEWRAHSDRRRRKERDGVRMEGLFGQEEKGKGDGVRMEGLFGQEEKGKVR